MDLGARSFVRKNMAYRDQLEAVRTRQESLEHEIAELRAVVEDLGPRPRAAVRARRIATGVAMIVAVPLAFGLGTLFGRGPAVAQHLAPLPYSTTFPTPRMDPVAPASAKPVEPKRAWRTDSVPTFADIAMTVNGKTLHFAHSCNSDSSGLASSLTMRKPKRPIEVSVTGCDGTYAYFHAWLHHPDEPGPATPSLFMVTLPGVDHQDQLANAARFQITNVTTERVAGTFEVDIRPANGAAPVHATGTFDVPRLPDETRPGP
jgi:hypothetical protein